jgi:putative PIN family toxin of toxin-antitoxin system
MLKRVVIDTNIILSGLTSKNGKSHLLLELLPYNKFEIAISVPLILEYETVLKKKLDRAIFSDEDISNFLNYICKIGVSTQIYYLWRPLLPDTYDDHILEVAVASESSHIITFNTKDFTESSKFGIKAIKPGGFISMVGGD